MTPTMAAETTGAVEALNRINDIVTRYCESQMLFTACELGLFDRLAAAPASADDLAHQVNVHPEACHRLLVGLAQMGLLERRDGIFSNAPVAAYLTAGAPVPLESLTMWG